MNSGPREGRSVRRARGWYAMAFLTLAAGCHGPSSPEATTAAPDPPQRVYELHCLGCHGAHGEGAWGPNIQSLNRTDPQIISVIVNGQGKMPSFRGHFSARELRQLAEYVKTFKYKP
jgi:mono/diheme cytochrome c family protein